MYGSGGLFALHGVPIPGKSFSLSLDVRCIRPCMVKVWKLRIWGDPMKINAAYHWVLDKIQENGPPLGWEGSAVVKMLS